MAGKTKAQIAAAKAAALNKFTPGPAVAKQEYPMAIEEAVRDTTSGPSISEAKDVIVAPEAGNNTEQSTEGPISVSPYVPTLKDAKESLDKILKWMDSFRTEFVENGGKNVMDLNLSMNHLGFSLNSLNKFIEEKK